jgi:putative ABC transport system permease protein
MNKLVFANLLHRPLRSIISVLAVAIEVMMILSIVGIFIGMLKDSKMRTNGVGADLMVLPSNASYFNGVSGAAMPVNDVIALRRLPHVAVAAPAIQHIQTSGSIEVIYGIDYPSFNALRPFVFLSGGPFQGPNYAIIDSVWATAHHHGVGDTIQILGQDFRVSGVVEPGKGGRVLVPIDTMGKLVDSPGKASLFYVKTDDAANIATVSKEIKSVKGLENNEVLSMNDWLDQMTPNRIPGFNIALNSVTGIAVIVGFLVIFQSMYTAVLERTREIGILKSMGASKQAIVGVVLRETAMLALAGVIVGLIGTIGVRELILTIFPTQHFQVTVGWLASAAAIAFVGALCGAIYPAWLAARKDPIDALAYE